MKKIKVCLINPTWSVPVGYEDRIRVPYPIGIIQIAAVLEQKNIEVKVIDALAQGWNKKKKNKDITIYGISDDELINEIKEFSPDYIGVGSLFTSQRDNVIRIVKNIKKKIKVPIIIGGVDPSIETEVYLKIKEIDYIVRGEADLSFLELIESLNDNGDLGKVKGIAYRNNKNKIIFNESSELLTNLDILPMPAYHLLNFKNYFDAGSIGLSSRGITVQKWMSIFTSRGCPYKCNFCSIHLISGRRWRGKSAKKVVDEIEYLYKNYGIDYFFFEDDNLTANPKRAEEIFDGIIKRKLIIEWETPNGVRADTMTDSLVRKMKASGCKKLILGIENGDQKFLREVIHKNLDLKKVVDATKIIRKHDIAVAGFFIIGIPGETRKIMINSILFAMKLARFGLVPGFTLATPLPKTEMYEDAKNKGYLIKEELTPRDYLISYSKPLMNTKNFTYTDLMRWKKIAMILTIFTLFLFHPTEIAKTNTYQEIKKHPGSFFKKIRAVVRGST